MNFNIVKNSRNQKKTFFSRLRKFALFVVLISILSGSTMTVNQKPAQGFWCFCFGIGCTVSDVIISTTFFFMWWDIWDPIIQDNIEDHLNSEENWIVEKFFSKFFIHGLIEMTTYLSAVGMYQVQIFGSFLDAKQQLETQRLFWRLHAEAHRDYQPSDDFCWFGTNSKSLANTEDRANFGRNVFSARFISRQVGNINSNASSGRGNDKDGRWNQFVLTYCNPKDNNWSRAASGPVKGTGLDLACDHDGVPGGTKGALDPKRVNRDIDFTRLIDYPRTLDINFETPNPMPKPFLATKDEEDVLAMASNLYGHDVINRLVFPSALQNDRSAQNLYLSLRSIIAKRSVAENSFNAIVALKSGGTGSGASSEPPQQVRQYMASLMKDMMPGSTPDEIYELIGENPSYYAQLEILAKRIYENPDFYANLYDTPANIERKSVAMKAIEMMLDRALFESELRQEMLLSVLLSGKLRPRFRDANINLQEIAE